MDRQSERTIQILEDMLRACVLDFGGHCEKYVPLVEIAYNNSYQQLLKCRHLKPCMVEDVGPLFVRKKLGTEER